MYFFFLFWTKNLGRNFFRVALYKYTYTSINNNSVCIEEYYYETIERTFLERIPVYMCTAVRLHTKGGFRDMVREGGPEQVIYLFKIIRWFFFCNFVFCSIKLFKNTVWGPLPPPLLPTLQITKQRRLFSLHYNLKLHNSNENCPNRFEAHVSRIGQPLETFWTAASLTAALARRSCRPPFLTHLFANRHTPNALFASYAVWSEPRTDASQKDCFTFPRLPASLSSHPPSQSGCSPPSRKTAEKIL